MGLDCDVRTLLELPYLNGVVHESLRLHSTSGQSIRHAFADDVVPLAAPINGHHSIVLPKGKVESHHYRINPDTCVGRYGDRVQPHGHELSTGYLGRRLDGI